MKKTIIIAWFAGTTLCSAQFYFEAGPWFRGGMKATVEGGSSAANAGTLATRPGTRGGMAWVDPLTPGEDDTEQILRQFDDGYVGPSAWGWASEEGSSQFFGFENAGQVNMTDGTLSFMRGSAESATALRTTTALHSDAAGWRDSKHFDGVGALATLGYTFLLEKSFDVSLQVQMGWLDGMDASFRGESAWGQQATWTTHESMMSREQGWTYVYDTYGNPMLPDAPYAMTDAGGVGPMISDRPIAIEDTGGAFATDDRVVGNKHAMAVSRVNLNLDVQSFVLAMGPRLRFRPTDRLAILAEGGLTANLLDAELSRTETFAWESGEVIQRWTDKTDKQKWLVGASVSLGAQFDITESLYFIGTAGYDWVDSCTLAVGPDRIDIDLSGWNVKLGLGYSFGR